MLALGGTSVLHMPSLLVARRAVKMSHAIRHAKNILHFRNVTSQQKFKEADAVPRHPASQRHELRGHGTTVRCEGSVLKDLAGRNKAAVTEHSKEVSGPE